MTKKLIIYTDGGARGNPGPAGIGVVICDGDNEYNILKTYKKYIGETTNNQAEYKAVVLALEKAKALKAEEVEIKLDSELVASQLNMEFKIKNPDFQESFIRIWNLRQEFKKVTFKHISREENKLADRLVNDVTNHH